MTLTARDKRLRGHSRWGTAALGIVTWLIAALFFFPVFWMVLNSFKTELVANASPVLFFEPTLDRWQAVTESVTGLLSFSEAFFNSFVIVIISTVLVMVLAIPAAYALAIYPIKAWRDALFFFISTKFLPVVASIFPIYVYAEKWNLIGTRTILVVLYTAMNLPLAVWMIRSFFMEVPRELIEAAEIDGTKLINQLRSVIMPMAPSERP